MLNCKLNFALINHECFPSKYYSSKILVFTPQSSQLLLLEIIKIEFKAIPQTIFNLVTYCQKKVLFLYLKSNERKEKSLPNFHNIFLDGSLHYFDRFSFSKLGDFFLSLFLYKNIATWCKFGIKYKFMNK